MRSCILPFRPVLRDFLRNVWALRSFLLSIMLMQVMCSAAGTRLEDVPHASRGTWIILFMQGLDFLRSFLGTLLLGLLIWVVQQSLGGHVLKKSKYLLIPTEEDM
jgi:hypothetical protein